MTPNEIMRLPEAERAAAIAEWLKNASKKACGVTTYRVFWKDADGYCGTTYIEVSDSFGRRKAAEVRRIFTEQYGGTILKVVKDC